MGLGPRAWMVAILAVVLAFTAGWAVARPLPLPPLTPEWRHAAPLRPSSPAPPAPAATAPAPPVPSATAPAAPSPPAPAAPAPAATAPTPPAPSTTAPAAPSPPAPAAPAPAATAPACPTSAPAPAPGPAPAGERTWKKIEIAASVCGSFLALVLSMAPLCYHVHNGGSIRKTLKLFSTVPMGVGLANAISWALYALAVLKRDTCFDLVMTNLLSAMANVNFLVFVWVSKRQSAKGYITIVVATLAFTAMFLLQQLEPAKTKPYEYSFGAVGCITLIIGHFIQIKDILSNCSTKLESISVICNVLPNMLLSVMSVIIVQLRHPDQPFIAVASSLNAVGFAIELIMILNKPGLAKLLTALNFTMGDDDSPDIELAVQGNRSSRPSRHLRQNQGQDGLVTVERESSRSGEPISESSAIAPNEAMMPVFPRRSRSMDDQPKGKKKGFRKWVSLGCS